MRAHGWFSAALLIKTVGYAEAGQMPFFHSPRDICYWHNLASFNKPPASGNTVFAYFMKAFSTATSTLTAPLQPSTSSVLTAQKPQKQKRESLFRLPHFGPSERKGLPISALTHGGDGRTPVRVQASSGPSSKVQANRRRPRCPGS